MDLAHSWYPPQCCGDKDCFIADCARLVKHGAQYFYNGIQSIPLTEFGISPDAFCHVCINTNGPEPFLRCIFTPLGIS